MQGLATPNLPGHTPLSQENWYVRQATDAGFRRGKDGKRPQSAGPRSSSGRTLAAAIAASREQNTVQWEKQHIGAMDLTFTGGGLPGGDQSQFQIEGSQMSLLEGGRSVASTVGSRPKTSGGVGGGGGGGRLSKRQQQEIRDAYQPQPQQHSPMAVADAMGRSRYAGPISPVVSQIRRRPENAGPMNMGRDASHVHSTSPFGRARYHTATAITHTTTTAATNSSSAAVAAATGTGTGAGAAALLQQQQQQPVISLDRYGYPEEHIPPKPVVEQEKRVCRYSAFFYEDRVWDAKCPIGTPTIERVVVRHLVISYYLVDNTVSIFEKKQENVGIDGGKFFKRAQLFKDDDAQPVRLHDLVPGKPLRVLGQEIMVRDADSFSRGVVEFELGLVLPPGLPKPVVAREDLGAHLALGMGRNPPPKRADNLYPPAYDFYQRKEALEKTHRFLFAERTPAAFECYEILDNVAAGKVPPERIDAYLGRVHADPEAPLIIPCNAQRLGLLYYMADYQVEVTLSFKAGEKVEHDENRTVLKKSKLPKNWNDVSRGRAPVFFEPTDFVCGQTIDLYGKIYFIVSCNSWTRDIYANKFAMQQTDVNVRLEDKPVWVHEIPGFGDGYLPIGTPEETLATVYGHAHAAHALRKDIKNLGRQLRCKAVLITDAPGHDRRMFNLTFYMEDGTIQVYEEVVKNSGFPGGMFLKRARVLNHLPPDQSEARFFKAQDIYLGNVLGFNGVEMRVVEMDGASLRFCEQNPHEFPMSDVFDIILRGLSFVIENAVDVRRAFASFDAAGTGMLSRSQFIAAMDAMGLTENQNDQELLTLIRRFKWAPNHKKKTNIFSPTREAADDDGGEDEGETKTGAPSQDDEEGGFSPGVTADTGKYLYEELCDLFSHVHCVDTRKKQPFRGVQHINSLDELLYAARACTTQWRRVLRIDPDTIDGLTTLAALAACMQRYGVLLSDAAKRQIAARFSVTGPACQRYEALRAKVLAQSKQNRGGAAANAVSAAAATAASAAATAGSAGLTLGGTGMGTGGALPSPGSPNFVQTRREMLQRPVLRSVKAGAESGPKRSSSATALLGAGADWDEKAIIVNSRALCDAVYVSDWVMLGQGSLLHR